MKRQRAPDVDGLRAGPALGPGSVIAERYRLEERLDSGGSADVWRATDGRLERTVAVKVLRPQLLPDEAARRRLEAEARAAGGLSHPAILAVHDYAVSEDVAAIVMEYVEGETLANLVARRRRLPPDEAARVGAEVAEALAHAHAAGVIHRDVKPANILIARDGRVRLVDFGIARTVHSGLARLTSAGTLVGTLRYLAPEQLAGEEAVPQTDIYALGLVLHEALTGEPAYDAAAPLALVEAQRKGPPALVDAPAGLAAIVERALQPTPAERHASAEEMAGALRAWLAGGEQGVAATASPSATTHHALPLAAAAAPLAAASAPRPGVSAPAAASRIPDRTLGRRGLVAGLVGVAVLLIVAVIAFGGAGSMPAAERDATPATAATAKPTPAPTARPEDDGDRKGKGRGRGHDD
ncbi:MAG TPA: serine/threonine-protein kinase [Candidatus Limnocylindrales bacterium]|nr:serine/threonine-protein kinase [Candidatus Limnocylindrales bacterium]